MAKLDRVIGQIKRILAVDTRGLTIQELSVATKVSRITTSLALAKLEGQGAIDVRVVGNCKLHYLKSKQNKSGGKRKNG